MKKLIPALIIGICLSHCLGYNNIPFKYDSSNSCMVNDSTVYSGNPTKNFDSSSSSQDVYYLMAGDIDSSGTYRSFLRFDFSKLGNSRINNCWIELWAESRSSNIPYIDADTTGNTTWTEGTINWNTQAVWTFSTADTATISSTKTYLDRLSWYEWDLTTEARTSQSNAGSKLTVALRSANEGTTGRWAKFHSREHPGYNGVTYRPALYIDNSYCNVSGKVYTQIAQNIASVAPNASVSISTNGGYSNPVTSDASGNYSGKLYVSDGCSGKSITVKASTTGFAGSANWTASSNNDNIHNVTMKPTVQAGPLVGVNLQAVSINDVGAQFATPAFAYSLPGSSVETIGFNMILLYDTSLISCINVEPAEMFIEGFQFDINDSEGIIIIQGHTPPGPFIPLGEPQQPSELCILNWQVDEITEPGQMTFVEVDSCQFVIPDNIASAIYHKTGFRLGEHQKDITVESPNGGEILIAGSTQEIQWNFSGDIDTVVLEYLDQNDNWQLIAAADNVGSYEWNVPEMNSQSCKIRISSKADPLIVDESDSNFAVYTCSLKSDASGDCVVNLNDLAIMANEWLLCGNIFDPICN